MKKLLISLILCLSIVSISNSSLLQFNEPVTAQAKSKVYFKNNVAKLNDIKIRIIKTKVIKPGNKGNEYGDKPVFAIWYKTTNYTKKDIDPITAWIVVFTAVQDNNKNYLNELDVASSPDERYYDTQTARIKKNGTVSNAIAYELDDLKTPVKLIAHQGIGGKKLGSKKYSVK